tara:strand:+ start:2566 stop:2754 length:189 start_codon:yes stop_codon:yes gene_type:complete
MSTRITEYKSKDCKEITGVHNVDFNLVTVERSKITVKRTHSLHNCPALWKTALTPALEEISL